MYISWVIFLVCLFLLVDTDGFAAKRWRKVKKHKLPKSPSSSSSSSSSSACPTKCTHVGDESVARCLAAEEMDCSPGGAFGINSENSYWLFGQPQFESFFTDPERKDIRKLEFSLWFKTTEQDGVLFFAENAPEPPSNILVADDFIGLSMQGGLVTFSTLTTVDRGVSAATTNNTYNDGEWHSAKMVKSGDFVTLTIDESGLNPEMVQGINVGPDWGTHQGQADLSAWFYIGGVPFTKAYKADEAMGVSQGFQGCISNITIADLQAGLPGQAFNVNLPVVPANDGM